MCWYRWVACSFVPEHVLVSLTVGQGLFGCLMVVSDAGSTSTPLQILDTGVCACWWLSMRFDVVIDPKSVRIAVASERFTNARAASK